VKITPFSRVILSEAKNLARFFVATLLRMTFFYVFLAPVFAAEEPKISVKAELSKAFITIGDPVTYSVVVQHTPEVKILSSIPPPDESILKVKKSENINKKEGNRIYEGKKFTVTAYSLGEYVLEPSVIQYLDTDGQTKTLQTDKIYLTVKSVAEGEEKTDIRGIKPVVPLPSKLLSWGLMALGVLAAALLALLIIKKKIRMAPPEPEMIRTSEEEALFQLSQLFDSDMIRRGKVKEYYLRLSEILRAYFERRFKFAAAEATTYEILRALKEKDIEPGLRDTISEVLEAADLAKFAKWKPEPAQIIQINQKAKQVVEMARPKETVSGV
jgi:hypothetical protein